MVLAAFVFVLVLVLWLLGARNRLIHHRRQLLQTFEPLALQLRKRHALARHAAETALRTGTLPREAVEAVLASSAQAADALQAARGAATRAEAMQRVAAAEEVLADALDPLLSLRVARPLTPAPADVAGPASAGGEAASAGHLDELLQRLAQVHAPLDYARLAYNGSVQAYNAALRVFPTTLAAATLRLPPGVQLPRLSRPPVT